MQYSAWKAAYQGIMSDEFLAQMDLSDTKANWKKWLSNQGVGRHVVIENDSGIVGFCVFGPARDDDLDKKDSAELVAINVLPDNWRSGYGVALLDAVSKELSESYTAIYLWVAEANQRARKFYESYGFTLEGSEKNVPSHGNIRELRYVSRYS